jgi:hypothetical protein
MINKFTYLPFVLKFWCTGGERNQICFSLTHASHRSAEKEELIRTSAIVPETVKLGPDFPKKTLMFE